MATFNKSEILKYAHKIVKHLGMTLSEALKSAWLSAKQKVARNLPKVKNTNWYKAPPKTVSVNCPNQGNFAEKTNILGVYHSTIAR